MQGLNLASSGAVEMSLGAVSVTAISKTLQRIAEAESVPFAPDQARSIAASANGDLLNAIETLQLYSSGKVDLSLLKSKKGKKVSFLISLSRLCIWHQGSRPLISFCIIEHLLSMSSF